jgi:hypothetical protein
MSFTRNLQLFSYKTNPISRKLSVALESQKARYRQNLIGRISLAESHWQKDDVLIPIIS